MKRWTLRILVCLILGAITTVAVACIIPMGRTSRLVPPVQDPRPTGFERHVRAQFERAVKGDPSAPVGSDEWYEKYYEPILEYVERDDVPTELQEILIQIPPKVGIFMGKALPSEGEVLVMVSVRPFWRSGLLPVAQLKVKGTDRGMLMPTTSGTYLRFTQDELKEIVTGPVTFEFGRFGDDGFAAHVGHTIAVQIREEPTRIDEVEPTSSEELQAQIEAAIHKVTLSQDDPLKRHVGGGVFSIGVESPWLSIEGWRTSPHAETTVAISIRLKDGESLVGESFLWWDEKDGMWKDRTPPFALDAQSLPNADLTARVVGDAAVVAHFIGDVDSFWSGDIELAKSLISIHADSNGGDG